MKWLALTLTNKFLSWLTNLRVLASFLVGMSLAAYLAGGLLSYSRLIGNMLQVCEPYLYATSDPKMFGAVMMGGLLLLSDAPFLTPLSQAEMLRIGRRKWIISQIWYIFLAAFLYFFVLMVFTAIAGGAACGVYFAGGWSDTLELLAFTRPGAAVSNFHIGFDFPEMLQAIGPAAALSESLVFHTLYLGLIGLLILSVNLYTRRNLGWIVGSCVHFLGYLIYANSGFGMEPRYSLLCCAIPGYHYSSGMRMPGIWCFFILFVLAAIIIQLCKRNAHRIEPFSCYA